MGDRALERIRPEVRAIKAYRVAAPPHRIKLNQNESPIELPEPIKAQVLERLGTIPWSRYPQQEETALADALRASLDLPRGVDVITGNGSNELIQALLTASLIPEASIAIPVPTFSLYRQFAAILGAAVVEVLLEADLSLDADRLVGAVLDSNARAVVIARPNNPTGRAVPVSGIERLLARTDALVVVDEAYVEFAGDSVIGLLGAYERLVVLRTFSKALRCAGLRIGCMAAARDLVEEVRKVVPPFNTSVFDREAALAIVRNLDLLRPGIEEAIAERDRLVDALDGIPGIAPIPSEANFVCFRTDVPPRVVFDRLLEHGILIRDVSGYPLLDDFLRVSVGTPEENRAFVAAMREIMEEQ
jgi:histidinol-phosphate aminotransferase